MKRSQRALAAFFMVLGAASFAYSRVAQAHGHVGVVIGVPLGPWYYPPAPYYYPPAVYEPSPPVYVEQAPVMAAPAPQESVQYYFYCTASKAYYPYVKDCPAGWERVPAQPR
jgi:hypothetical protein